MNQVNKKRNILIITRKQFKNDLEESIKTKFKSVPPGIHLCNYILRQIDTNDFSGLEGFDDAHRGLQLGQQQAWENYIAQFNEKLRSCLENNIVIYDHAETETENIYLFYYWSTEDKLYWDEKQKLILPILPFVKEKQEIIRAICKDLNIKEDSNNLLFVHDSEWLDSNDDHSDHILNDLDKSGLSDLFGEAHCFQHVKDQFHYYPQMLELKFDNYIANMKEPHLKIKNAFESGELTVEEAIKETQKL